MAFREIVIKPAFETDVEWASGLYSFVSKYTWGKPNKAHDEI